MTSTLLPGVVAPGVRRNTSPHPYTGPGEDQFATWCEQLGLRFRHEPYLYELIRVFECSAEGTIRARIHKGFTPDFLVTVSDTLPEVHVELTTANRGGRRRKVVKIRGTQEAFRAHTILLIVDSPLWRRMERNPHLLKRLLLRASYRAQNIVA